MKDRNADRPKAPLGRGERFSALVRQLGRKPGAGRGAGLDSMVKRSKFGASRLRKAGS